MNQILNALSSGYTSKQVLNFIMKKFPQHKDQIENALLAGFTAEKILQHFTKDKNGIPNKNIQALTEKEKLSQSEEQKKRSREKMAVGALGTAAAVATPYILPRVASYLPQAMQSILPSQPQGPSPTPSPMQQTPGQAIGQNIQQGQTPGQPPQVPPVAPTGQQAPQVNPQQVLSQLPGVESQINKLADSGNDANQIDAYFEKFAKESKKNAEKSAGMPFVQLVDQYIQGRQQQQETPQQQPIAPEQNVPRGTAEQIPTSQIPESPKIDLTGMGKGMMDNFYEGIFKSLSEGKDTFAGVKDPLIQKAKPEFQKGNIKSPEDLRKFANNLSQIKEEEFPKIDSKTAQKGETVITESGDIGILKGISGHKALIEENGKLRQVPIEQLRGQPEAIRNSKVIFDPSAIPEEDRSAALAFVLPLPDKMSIIDIFHNGKPYLYKRKDGKPFDESIIRRIIDGTDIPLTSGDAFMGAWNTEKGDSRGSANHKELVSRAQKAGEPDDPTKDLIYEEIDDSFIHGFHKEFMNILRSFTKAYAAKPKKPKKG